MKRRYPNSEISASENSASENLFFQITSLTPNIQTVMQQNNKNISTLEIKDTDMVDLTDTPTDTSKDTPTNTSTNTPTSINLPLKAGTKRNLSVRDLTDSRDNEEFLKFKKDYGKYKTEEEIWNEELRDIYFS